MQSVCVWGEAPCGRGSAEEPHVLLFQSGTFKYPRALCTSSWGIKENHVGGDELGLM